jgi:hypothetical protein
VWHFTSKCMWLLKKMQPRLLKVIIVQKGRIFYKLRFLQYRSITPHTIGSKPEWIRHSHTVNSATKIVADTHQPPDPTAMKLPSPPDMDLFRNELPGNQNATRICNISQQGEANACLSSCTFPPDVYLRGTDSYRMNRTDPSLPLNVKTLSEIRRSI